MGQSRDLRCPCGNVYERPGAVDERRRKARNRNSLSVGKGFAASPAQREKVRGMVCLGCGREAGASWTIDPAHVWPQSKGGCADPDCVVPLCRWIPDGSGCHQLFDEGALDLLPRLAGSEAYAVEQAHPILCHGVSVVELARRLAGNERELVWVERERVA